MRQLRRTIPQRAEQAGVVRSPLLSVQIFEYIALPSTLFDCGWYILEALLFIIVSVCLFIWHQQI